MDSDREALRVPHPCLFILHTGKAPGRFRPDGRARGDAADHTFEDPARIDVQSNVGRLSDFDVPEVVLGEVGLDPNVVEGAKGHERFARLRKGSFGDGEIDHSSVCRRTQLRPLQGEFCLSELGYCRLDLRIICARIAELLTRSFEIRFRSGYFALRLLQLSARIVRLGLCDHIFLLQFKNPGSLHLGVFQIHLCLGQVRPCDFDPRRAGSNRLGGRLQGSPGLIDRKGILTLVDARQQISGVDELSVVHCECRHVARDLRHDRDDDGFHPGIGRVGCEPVGHQIPDKEQHGQAGEYSNFRLHRVIVICVNETADSTKAAAGGKASSRKRDRPAEQWPRWQRKRQRVRPQNELVGGKHH